jgi:hypothetical protein
MAAAAAIIIISPVVNIPVQNCGRQTSWKHILKGILMYHLSFTQFDEM